jgi:hypothetical protein
MICLDHSGNFFCLSIYNVGKSFTESIKYGSTPLAILDPNLLNVKYCLKERVYEYPCIQVNNLSKMLVDGKFCANYTSNALLNSKFFN